MIIEGKINNQTQNWITKPGQFEIPIAKKLKHIIKEIFERVFSWKIRRCKNRFSSEQRCTVLHEWLLMVGRDVLHNAEALERKAWAWSFTRNSADYIVSKTNIFTHLQLASTTEKFQNQIINYEKLFPTLKIMRY